MSNVNNKQKVKKLPSARKQQAMSNHLEEFGVESNFDAKHFKKEGKFSTKDKPESERTAWN